MNDHDIESLLTSLSPARPSAALAQSVDRELESDLSWARALEFDGRGGGGAADVRHACTDG
jgi:hypothetical protein